VWLWKREEDISSPFPAVMEMRITFSLKDCKSPSNDDEFSGIHFLSSEIFVFCILRLVSGGKLIRRGGHDGDGDAGFGNGSVLTQNNLYARRTRGSRSSPELSKIEEKSKDCLVSAKDSFDFGSRI